MSLSNFILGPSNSSVNNITNRILTRYNLENSKKLKNLTANEIIALKNPNKNSCLVTKLEIVKKICRLKKISNTEFKNNLSKYITELKKENLSEPVNNNFLLRKENSNTVDSSLSAPPPHPLTAANFQAIHLSPIKKKSIISFSQLDVVQGRIGQRRHAQGYESGSESGSESDNDLFRRTKLPQAQQTQPKSNQAQQAVSLASGLDKSRRNSMFSRIPKPQTLKQLEDQLKVIRNKINSKQNDFIKKYENTGRILFTNAKKVALQALKLLSSNKKDEAKIILGNLPKNITNIKKYLEKKYKNNSNSGYNSNVYK